MDFGGIIFVLALWQKMGKMPVFRFCHFDQKNWKQCFLQISSWEFTKNSEHFGHLNFSNTFKNDWFTDLLIFDSSPLTNFVNQSFLKIFEKFKCPKCSEFFVDSNEEICRKHCFQFFWSKWQNLKTGIFHVFCHRAKTKMIPPKST